MKDFRTWPLYFTTCQWENIYTHIYIQTFPKGRKLPGNVYSVAGKEGEVS